MDNDVQGHENGAAWGERRCSSSHGHTGMSRLRTGGVVIVDELGKMELASAVMQLLERDVAVVATVHQARDRFTDALRRRPDIRVVRVTEATRDALPEQLIDRLVGTPRGEQQ
jgi:nucleoside-triphosphatase THEP1